MPHCCTRGSPFTWGPKKTHLEFILVPTSELSLTVIVVAPRDPLIISPITRPLVWWSVHTTPVIVKTVCKNKINPSDTYNKHDIRSDFSTYPGPYSINYVYNCVLTHWQVAVALTTTPPPPGGAQARTEQTILFEMVPHLSGGGPFASPWCSNAHSTTDAHMNFILIQSYPRSNR